MQRKSQNALTNLVKKCRAGDKEAWAVLVDVITPVIFSICRRMRLSREESFDIFGQVCYLLLKNLENIKSAEKVVGYVATMTRREIYAYHRKHRLYESLENQVHDFPAEADRSDPDKMLEKTRRSEKLIKALLSLPERDFELIRMLFLEKDTPSYKETSRRLGIPEASIGPTRARSLKKLYRILKRKKFDF